MHLRNDSPSFHPVHACIRAIGPRVLHHSKGRGHSRCLINMNLGLIASQNANKIPAAFGINLTGQQGQELLLESNQGTNP